MKKLFLTMALLLCSATFSFAQAPTKICVPNANGGCQDVTVSYPFPVNATASIAGFMGNGGYGTLTSTASSSASTAIPAASSGLAATTAVRITNNGTSEVSCTFATGAATGTTNNIQVPTNSSVVRGTGLFDHIACINQAGDSASNTVVLESGTGLGNDSGGGSSGGGSGGNVNLTQVGGSNISIGQALSAASLPVVLPAAQITTLTPIAWSNSNQIGNTAFGITGNGNTAFVTAAHALFGDITSMGGTAINSGCVASLSGFSSTIPATVCGVFGTYVLNTNGNIEWNADSVAATTNGSPTSSLGFLFNGTTVDRARSGTITGAALTQSGSQYPSGSTPITASATGTTAATTATLAGTTGKTTYICSYSIRANATAAATVTDTVTGVITATMSSLLWVAPLASGLGVDEQIFSPCVPASATNTGIAVVSGAPGSGGNVTVHATGYQL